MHHVHRNLKHTSEINNSLTPCSNAQGMVDNIPLSRLGHFTVYIPKSGKSKFRIIIGVLMKDENGANLYKFKLR